MRIVVDTNVFVTALLHGQTPRRIYEAFLDGRFTPVFSSETLAELLEVLSRPPLRVLMRETEVMEFLRLVQHDCAIVRPTRRILACRDSKDNILLECALKGRVSYLVTGDRDLLILNPFHGIRILRPSEFLRFLT